MADNNGDGSTPASGSSQDDPGRSWKKFLALDFTSFPDPNLSDPKMVAPAAKNQIAAAEQDASAQHQEAPRADLSQENSRGENLTRGSEESLKDDFSLPFKKRKRSHPAESSVARQEQEIRDNNGVSDNKKDLDDDQMRSLSEKKMKRVSFKKTIMVRRPGANNSDEYIDVELDADYYELPEGSWNQLRSLLLGEMARIKISTERDGVKSVGSDKEELALNLSGENNSNVLNEEIKEHDDDVVSIEKAKYAEEACVGRRSFKCRYCYRNYDSKLALGRHLKQHREQRKLEKVKKAMTGFDGDTSEFEKYMLWRQKATKPADRPKVDTTDQTTPEIDDNGIDLTLRL